MIDSYSFHLPAIGTMIRAKRIGSDYWLDSEWSEWFTFEGVKLSAPVFGDYDTQRCEMNWSIWDAENISHYLYTINGGEAVRVELYDNCSVVLNHGDRLRVKCVASEEGIANGYIDSDWVKYTCVDEREVLATPNGFRLNDDGYFLIWDSVDDASYYVVEQTLYGRTITFDNDSTRITPKHGGIYRVRAVSEDIEHYRMSAWSESFTYRAKLDSPYFIDIFEGQIRWGGSSRIDGYYYKIGEDGEVQSTTNRYLSLSLVPLGESLYVKAYQEGYLDSDWVMMYENIKTLATPEVTVSGGVASWESIDGADGYLYKINDGEERVTTALSVSGLVGGDRIVVAATSTQKGYVNSNWSDERKQMITMPVPVIDLKDFYTMGKLSWERVDGADYYICEVDGVEYTCYEMWGSVEFECIEYGSVVRIRAACYYSEDYETLGQWSEYYTREDDRFVISAPTIAYDVENGLTVIVDETVGYYIYKCGQNDEEHVYFPEYTGEVEVITQSSPMCLNAFSTEPRLPIP